VLTPEQLRAIASPAPRLFLEAAPGAGKTTVAAHRFAVQRWDEGRRTDSRGVIAVSFTRSATAELRERVRRLYGRTAAQRPHRIATLDTLIYDLLQVLLARGHVVWPGGHKELEVVDNWRALVDAPYSVWQPAVRLDGNRVLVDQTREAQRAARPDPSAVATKLAEGICTHEEVRAVLSEALKQTSMRDPLVEYLAMTARALIVDEVFDGNELDLAVVKLACAAGLEVTLIGDPWQALYRFRGARPDLVPGLVAETEMTTLPLSASFRWRTDEQAELARRLRNGESVLLPSRGPSDEPDAILACEWRQLWELDAHVLPLAFGSAKGNAPEAGATLLLDYVTRSLLGLDATYIGDALSTLRIGNPEAIARLDAGWPKVIEALCQDADAGPKAGYQAMVDLLSTETSTPFPPVHWQYTKRLGWLRERLLFDGDMVPGMTIHQAKGREWDNVGLALQDAHKERLLRGLTSAEATDRQLYVGCTRACVRTVAM